MADNQIFPKGSRVEVSIFEGALYVATVVDIIQVTPTKNTKKTPTKNTKKTPGKRLSKNTKNGMGYLVEYDELYETEIEIDGRHLREIADPLLVRPVPPEDMVKNKEFSEGDIVDALDNDGWWIGAIKKLVIDGEDEGKYLVGFENPTEELVFEKEKLRPHLDWVDSRWKVPPKNKKDGDPMFTCNFRKRSRGGEKSGASPGVERKEAVQSGYQAMHQDSPIVEQEAITTVCNFGNLMA